MAGETEVKKQGRPGRVCWHDVNAIDTDSVMEFMGEVVEWKRGTRNDNGYTMIEAPHKTDDSKSVSIGGLVDLRKMADLPPDSEADCTSPYIEVTDLAACVQRVKKNGGVVAMEKMTVTDVGEFAICQDPEGVKFLPFVPHEKILGDDIPDHRGCFCWHDLYVENTDKMRDFYTKVFPEWTYSEMDMGGTMYGILNRPAVTDKEKERAAKEGGVTGIAGLTAIGEKYKFFQRSRWIMYITVPDVKAAVDRAVKAGGKQLGETETIPMGVYAYIQAPKGGLVFGVYAEPPQGDEKKAEEKEA